MAVGLKPADFFTGNSGMDVAMSKQATNRKNSSTGPALPGGLQDRRSAFVALSPSLLFPTVAFIIKQHIGESVALVSWNFPIGMVIRKAAAVMAAGCTMIIKPSLETPLSPLALADLAL
ncbi:hypothetical protein E4T49_08559 [Aureobasidium sp. EXF-10728]|nr:hypothetical protein E4T49_08559 [Aureobasidium sp. EXF-10728]